MTVTANIQGSIVSGRYRQIVNNRYRSKVRGQYSEIGGD